MFGYTNTSDAQPFRSWSRAALIKIRRGDTHRIGRVFTDALEMHSDTRGCSISGRATCVCTLEEVEKAVFTSAERRRGLPTQAFQLRAWFQQPRVNGCFMTLEVVLEDQSQKTKQTCVRSRENQ